MDPLAAHLIMILGFLVGSGLIIAEAFMPGFGVAGISGIVLEIVAIVFTGQLYGTVWALVATLAVILVIGTAVFLSYRSALHGRLSRSALVLKDTEETSSASPAPDTSWEQKKGVAVTALRPAGIIEVGGARLNAATSGEFLEKGSAVLVTGASGDHLLVRKV